MQINKLADENLFRLCKVYGGRALMWRAKFTGLLPEVFKRKLYVKKGFDSIFEFAKKLAGLSEEQVRLTLNLEKKFEKLPELKNLLVSGEVSVNKLARVASIATAETEQFWAENLKNLSKSAVETLVRDEKFRQAESDVVVGRVGLFEPQGEGKSLPGQRLELSSEVEEKLIELQQKGINVNELLLEFLKKREIEIAQEKEQVSQEILKKEEEKEPTRHIPKSAKEILHQEFGTKCAVKTCKKPSASIHHKVAFSITRSHDPRYLVPLCKEHHELEHAVNWQYQDIRSKRMQN
ncbi:MAG: HNH endonuclease [Patescibacteria group bacterium]